MTNLQSRIKTPAVFIQQREIYVLKPEHLTPLLKELRAIGYEFEEKGVDPEDEYEKYDRTYRETHAMSNWFGTLDTHRGKCSNCNSIISLSGIKSHKHKCEFCGEYTYLKIIPGSKVRFEFCSSARVAFATSIEATVHYWDDESGDLYLLKDSITSKGLIGCDPHKYLEQNQADWEDASLPDCSAPLFRVKYYNLPWQRDCSKRSAIEMLDTYGHHWGHTIVNIFDGQEYPEFGFDKDKMPVPNMIHIYEAWHWAPLQPSPKLHEKLLSSVGMVPDIGFYHQDGRAAFSQSHIDGITDYIENLTSLNGEAWKQIAQSIPLDARGFITTLAYFCHNHPSVAEVPNVWNAVNAAFGEKMSKATQEFHKRDQRQWL
jgi:hypothetical protein